MATKPSKNGNPAQVFTTSLRTYKKVMQISKERTKASPELQEFVARAKALANGR